MMRDPQPSNPKANSWIGQTIGDRNRYRITSRLGGGGMGDVFLATDTLLGQQVALKMLKDKLLEEPEVRQRFEREALLCAAIQGEHVVQVNDYGLTDEGYPFFVMEYLRGQTLGDLLQKERHLSIERTVKIVSQICDGLFKAHSGVVLSHEGTKSDESIYLVHRDLKPENIFLVSTSLGELVKILDFGIAKVVSKEIQSTNTGLFMGTFQYAAPEQIEGRKDLDLRADIYSLGMIIYEMLCGTDPFGCLTDGRGGANWLRAHISDPPRSLRSQPNGEHIPDLLEAVVLRCLSKSPSDRFASVVDLYQALQQATGIKTDAIMMRLIASSAATTISRPDLSGFKETIPNASNSSQSKNSQSKNSQSKNNDAISGIKDKLENVLMSYVGPIAKILVKQTSIGSTNPSDVIERLSQHIPLSQQKEFKAKAQTAFFPTEIKSTTPQTDKTKTTANSSVNAAISAPPITNSANNQTNNQTNKQINQAFIDQCQQELSQVIGPMAKLIIKKALVQNPSQSQLIEAIARQIPDANQAEKFRKKFN